MSEAALPTFHNADGSYFIAEQRVRSDDPLLKVSADDLRAYVKRLWREAFEAKRPHTERMKVCSLYYDGFHYNNATMNRTKPVANYCFGIVETVVPTVTEMKPRPEIVPRRTGMARDQVDRLQEAASWLMDLNNFDEAFVQATREKCKLGASFVLISFDYASGVPVVRNLSDFDIYPDPAARSLDDAQHFFLATAVQTTLLQATWPKYAHLLKPDGLASPSYDVNVRPFLQYLSNATSLDGPEFVDSALSFASESEATPTTSTVLEASAGSRQDTQTTFLLQLFVRDETMMPVVYMGTKYVPSPDGQHVPVPGMTQEGYEPCCPSKWRVITMTASGVFPEAPRTLDDCFGGLPIVMGRRYAQLDRFWTPGDIDQILPLQRADNRMRDLLQKSLELSANPPAVTNRDSGLRTDIGTIEGGEVLRINRGSDLKWLEYRGPSEHQFEMLGLNKADMTFVSGVQDSQRGERPAGIEAAAAIRRLQEAANIRVRGMENPGQRERALVLKKMMTCLGKKASGAIQFHAAGGKPITVEPSELLDEFDIQFAAGSGSVAGRQDQEDKAFALYDRKAIDELELLRAVGWKNAEEIAARMAERAMQEAVMVAAQQAQSAPAGAQGGGKA